ncbi:MAG: hypothetical protein D6756_07920 [Cyanobacteria bacterium J083]|nr:MAG: hypothetical protein D6756_07920 [Cyanobacteria bacterium J083]
MSCNHITHDICSYITKNKSLHSGARQVILSLFLNTGGDYEIEELAIKVGYRFGDPIYKAPHRLNCQIEKVRIGLQNQYRLIQN